jgi:cobalt-zinc-cadmium efflux system protein
MMDRTLLRKRFRIFIFLSAFVLAIEVAGGILTNSLALLSDAAHVFIDLLALSLAYLAMRLAQRKSTDKYSFGYYRAEILASVINGVVLILITLMIFYESYLRLLSPEPVRIPTMLIIAIIGFIANLWVVIRMHGHEHGNLNVRGAYLHVLGDTLSSVGVIIAAALMLATGSYIFDPIISAVIGIFILVGSLGLIRSSLNVLMEATPEAIDIGKVERDMRKMAGVKEVHDIHIWCISSDVCNLTAHVLIDARDAKSLNRIVSRLNAMLEKKYSITHTVIQSECENCVDAEGKHSH